MVKSTFERLCDKSPHIFLDIDGVLFATNDAMCEILNKKYDMRHKGCEVTNWNYDDLYPVTEKEVDDLFESKEFFRKVKFVKGAKRFLTKYRDKIIVVTKCSQMNYARKRIYFDKAGFSDIPIIPLDFKMSKGIINMRSCLFVDDCTYNLKESNARWKIMFMEYNDGRDRSWQQKWKGDRLYRW